MKEAYFTTDSISRRAREMVRTTAEQVRQHSLPFKAAESALLVLDMQRYFIEEASHACIPSARAIIPRIVSLVNEYSGRDLPVVFTRHLNSARDAKLMAAWWEELICKDDPLSEIIEELSVFDGMVVEKSQYDAFLDTPLEKMLADSRVKQVVICGVMTHLCCETTARSAFMRGLEVFFTVDGTATYHEAFHLATLLNLSHGFARPALVEDLLTSLRRNGD